MGSTFYVSKESKDKQGKSRGAWRYECKERKIIDTFNAKFSREWSRIREAGITQSVSDLITQLIELHERQELKSGFTVSEYAEKYITFKTTRYRREPHVTESKIKAHEYRQHHYLKHFVNRYGRKRIEDITMEDAESYYNERMSAPPERGNKPLTHNVILLELTYVSSMFNHAIKYGHLKSVNPIRQAEFHKADNHRKRVLTPQEEERLLKHCDGDLFDIVILLLNTGMRKEELLSAEWSWIDTKKRLLNLPAHATKARKARDVRLNDDSIEIINKRKFVTKGENICSPQSM